MSLHAGDVFMRCQGLECLNNTAQRSLRGAVGAILVIALSTILVIALSTILVIGLSAILVIALSAILVIGPLRAAGRRGEY